MQTLRLETSSLVYGSIAFIIYLFPYFMYAKEFFGDNGAIQKGDYFATIGKVIGWHLVFVFFAIAFTSIAEIMMSYRPEFTPSAALKEFFHTEQDWRNLIYLMVNKSVTGISASSTGVESSNLSQEATYAYQITTNYYGIAIAMFMLMVPIIVVSITMAVALKSDERSEIKGAPRIFIAAVAFAFISFLVWFHALFASTYVSVFTGADFSFYEIMSSFWNLLLLD